MMWGEQAGSELVGQVGELLGRTARTVILPAYRNLAVDEVSEKAPGELVTVVDRRAEEVLTVELSRLLPGSTVVGEEAVDADRALLARIDTDELVWLVDPLDGTGNYASGEGPFAVMVALRRGQRTEAGWILDPQAGSLAVACAGAGTWLDGRRVRLPAGSSPARELRGASMTRFLPAELVDRLRAGAHRLGEVLPGQHCAAAEYRDILLGRLHFVLFWRTLPWDHTAGVLLVEEAGGMARRLDGSPYHPSDGRTGLLVAANAEIWRVVHDALLAAGPPTSR
jgi:fructose-1,6-bisphosphatase/inositol monophosphatase family enzyme